MNGPALFIPPAKGRVLFNDPDDHGAASQAFRGGTGVFQQLPAYPPMPVSRQNSKMIQFAFPVFPDPERAVSA